MAKGKGGGFVHSVESRISNWFTTAQEGSIVWFVKRVIYWCGAVVKAMRNTVNQRKATGGDGHEETTTRNSKG